MPINRPYNLKNVKQLNVILGAISVLADKDGVFTSDALGESLELAQQYLPPYERLKGKVTTFRAGRLLSPMAHMGYVEYIGHKHWKALPKAGI